MISREYMGQETLTNKVLKGTLWSFVESFSRQFISFVLGLVLARLLYPSDYGLIGMLMFFIAICQVFIDCGFANALICKNDRNDKDFSTAFYFNLMVGVGTYAFLFIIAPFVASFYNEPELNVLLRVVGLTVFFNSLCIVQTAILTSSLRMRQLTRTTVISQIGSGVVGIAMAYAGFGVWALAVQSVGGAAITTVILWIITKWHPREPWSKESFKYLWGFGSKMLFVGLVSNVYSNIHSLLIGKYFAKDDLGLYSKAQNLSRIVPNTLYSVLNKVSLPSLSAISNDTQRLKRAFRTYIIMAAFVVFPIMGLLMVLAKPLILFLWTERWAGAIPVFQIMCFGCVWNTIDLLSISILQVKHRPDLLLRLEVINKIVGLSILFVSIPMGFYAVIIGRSIYNFYEFLVYTTTNKKLISYTYWEQFKDIMPCFVIAVVSSILAYVAQSYFNSNLIKLLVGGMSGVLCYIMIARILNFKAWNDTVSLVKSLF